MKSEELYKIVNEEILPDCFGIMRTKGMAYSGKEDKLGNFKRVAQLLKQTPLMVWFVYFTKHFDAIASYIRGEYKDSEPIEGRIKDGINYFFLLYGLIKEKENEQRTD